MARDIKKFDDEIDLMAILKFILDIRIFWVLGSTSLGVLAFFYMLMFPTLTLEKVIINDIELDESQLALVINVIEADLGDDFRANNLKIMGIGNVSRGLENIIRQEKIYAVKILVKGTNESELRELIESIKIKIRNENQYLLFSKWVTDQSIITIKELEKNLNALKNFQIEATRLRERLVEYEKLENSRVGNDTQFILNLNSNSDISGAKYLPISLRIMALKTEIVDVQEGMSRSKNIIGALQMQHLILDESRRVISITKKIAGNLNMGEFLNILNEKRNPNLSVEEAHIIDLYESKFKSYASYLKLFDNSLPISIGSQSQFRVVITFALFGLLLGGLTGILYYVYLAYRRRYI